jgi:GDA1/CD39 (nucleoside phosphatase) family
MSKLLYDRTRIDEQMAELLGFAKALIPVDRHAFTNLSLKATAGLRGLSVPNQQILIRYISSIFADSGFAFNPAGTRVISGGEEAMYDFLAVKTAFMQYPVPNMDSFSIGAADLGGSSQQVAFLSHVDINFVPDDVSSASPVLPGLSQPSCFPDWNISRLPHVLENTQLPSTLFAKSMMGLGLVAAMDGVVHALVQDTNRNMTAADVDMTGERSTSTLRGSTRHPCVSPGSLSYESINGTVYPLEGTGNWQACYQLIHTVLIPKSFSILSRACMVATRPRIIIGMDNFPKVLEVLGLPIHSGLSPKQIYEAGLQICNEPWTVTHGRFPHYPFYRSQRACFGAVYVYSVLTSIYGIEEEDNHTFVPLESHGSYELSWALGAAVYEALGLTADGIFAL